jgi:hypothetical protein
MIVRQCIAIASMALAASYAAAQSEPLPEAPVTNSSSGPPPAIWGAMDAFELNRRAWRLKRPDIAFDRGYVDERNRQREASLRRERTRYTERGRDTQQAGTPRSASVGAGEPPAKQ